MASLPLLTFAIIYEGEVSFQHWVGTHFAIRQHCLDVFLAWDRCELKVWRVFMQWGDILPRGRTERVKAWEMWDDKEHRKGMKVWLSLLRTAQNKMYKFI